MNVLSAFDSFLEYELVNLSAVLGTQQPLDIGGEPVTLSVTAMLTANLSGEVEAPAALPALGGVAMLVLSAGLALIGGRAARRHQVNGPFAGTSPVAAALRIGASRVESRAADKITLSDESFSAAVERISPKYLKAAFTPRSRSWQDSVFT